MSRGLVLALLTVGCLREPTYNGPRDADPDGNEAVVPTCAGGNVAVMPAGTNDAGAHVCGPDYEVLFSHLGARMPYQLNVGGTQLIALGQACNDERGIGIGLFPSSIVNGEARMNTAGTVTIAWNGPVVGRVKVDWDVNYTCSANATLQDYSIFTFFPDGHITRFDKLRQTPAVSTPCNNICPGGGNSGTQYLTSFTTLAAPTGSAVTGASIDNDLVLLGAQVTNVRNPCLTTSGRAIAFGYRDARTRMRVVQESPRAIAFVYDSLVNATIGPDFADNVLTHTHVSTTSSCGTLAPIALQWSDRPGLRVQGSPIGPANDGIYGGENDSGDTGHQTLVGDVPIQLQDDARPVPAGAALWLAFGTQAQTNVQVLHNGVPSMPTGDWYRIQRISGTQLLFYFRDPIVAGTVVTVRPGS